MLEARKISVGYGIAEVVSEVSFTLAPGRVIALLGANGAGKTTLLKTLNGRLGLKNGEVVLNGQPLSVFSRHEIAQSIAVVAQETETKFPVTALEFVLSGRFAHGGVLGWESGRDLRIAIDCLSLCDLAGFENRLMNKLSGGERQRVVLARALATEAHILLLDEPTANLDLAHQIMMFRLVRERCETCESAAVVITHDLNLAAEFADEILLLKDGRIAAKGAPGDVLTSENIREVFAVDALIDAHPVSRKPRVTAGYGI
jgi:iron complex transport system ATP-binding protein